MANTFLFAEGKNIGKSLCEKDLKETALQIQATAKAHGCKIFLPSDVVVTKKFEQNSAHKTVAADAVLDDDIIVDIGAQSVAAIASELQTYKTLVWNGPLGAFEIKPFDAGTNGLAHEVATLTRAKKIVSVAGGGDVVAALNACNLVDDFTYISTAGGAFLEWLEGKELPGVSALKA
jgi:phosphoglycerate kinase